MTRELVILVSRHQVAMLSSSPLPQSRAIDRYEFVNEAVVK
jgi:hypothetical protein